jgi:hypothetical protein
MTERSGPVWGLWRETRCAAFRCDVTRQTKRGRVRIDSTPPMGPSGTVPGGGNSAPAREPVARPGKSPGVSPGHVRGSVHAGRCPAFTRHGRQRTKAYRTSALSAVAYRTGHRPLARMGAHFPHFRTFRTCICKGRRTRAVIERPNWRQRAAGGELPGTLDHAVPLVDGSLQGAPPSRVRNGAGVRCAVRFTRGLSEGLRTYPGGRANVWSFELETDWFTAFFRA